MEVTKDASRDTSRPVRPLASLNATSCSRHALCSPSNSALRLARPSIIAALAATWSRRDAASCVRRTATAIDSDTRSCHTSDARSSLCKTPSNSPAALWAHGSAVSRHCELMPAASLNTAVSCRCEVAPRSTSSPKRNRRSASVASALRCSNDSVECSSDSFIATAAAACALCPRCVSSFIVAVTCSSSSRRRAASTLADASCAIASAAPLAASSRARASDSDLAKAFNQEACESASCCDSSATRASRVASPCSRWASRSRWVSANSSVSSDTRSSAVCLAVCSSPRL
mmetsp:Transcript_27014/g.58650  ORF Transcript_27014/g.58650 Transcript_27014/m.58650 type:complete len:288 (+) Transcript_27014:85-948(+)